MRPALPVNLELNPDLIYLIEALKVEGYWSMKHREGSIQNKNLPFLKEIERILKDIGLNIKKRILIKIRMPEKLNKKEIRVCNKNKELKFHIEKSPFSKSKKVVFILPYEKEYNLTLNSMPICLYEGEEEFKIKSDLESWAYLELRFWNANFIRFLENYVKDKKKLKIEDYLFKSSGKFVSKAFSALIDSEGNLVHRKLFRRISIRMRSEKYLEDWKRLLKNYNVDSRFRKSIKENYIEYSLDVEGLEDFEKLINMGLKLNHSKKSIKWKEMINSYKRKQISRNTAYKFYIEKLKEINKPVKAIELSEYLGKSKRVISHYLTRLMRKNMINVNKSNVAYLYSYKESSI